LLVCLFICFLLFKSCSNTGLATGCRLFCCLQHRGFPFHKIWSQYIKCALPIDA
jgi:hypothetical protein